MVLYNFGIKIPVIGDSRGPVLQTCFVDLVTWLQSEGTPRIGAWYMMDGVKSCITVDSGRESLRTGQRGSTAINRLKIGNNLTPGFARPLERTLMHAVILSWSLPPSLPFFILTLFYFILCYSCKAPFYIIQKVCVVCAPFLCSS